MAKTTSATPKGATAGRMLKRAAKANEEKTERDKGSALKKGAARFDERSRSSDGKSAGTKQKVKPSR